MVLKLEIKKQLTTKSDRVKCVDFHPTENWLCVSLYNGQVNIWDYELNTLLKSFEVSDLPVRTGKFISRKNWLIVGSDDLHLRVFNYNTHEKVHSFEAHMDYIRSLGIHPTQPFVLSCADDMLIKMWDWEKGWKNVMVFEGHSHYVMSVVFNPKDTNTFATASLDKSIKVWNISSSTCNYTLDGHDKGVNWVDYYHGNEKPYLVSCSDDKTVKVWDYQNKTCVQTLEGHSQNVCFSVFHPELPIIISGSEDGTVKIWHSNTYRLENTLNYRYERVWYICCKRGVNCVALGYDEGTIVIKLGKEDPAISMDSSGKLIWARHNEIQSSHVQQSDFGPADGDPVHLSVKDLGNCEVFPQYLKHSPNGRFAVVCGDGEYIIYTALSWRNKSFGNAIEFVWSKDNEYAIRDSFSKIVTFKNFKERSVIKPGFTVDSIDGGELIAVKSSQGLVGFWDWGGAFIRRIDVNAKSVYWNEGSLVVLSTEESYYVLKYNRDAVESYLSSLDAGASAVDGCEEAFEVVAEIGDSVKNGCWIGDCFIYITTSNRLNYLVGNQVQTIAHFDTTKFLLGYLLKESKVLVADKDFLVYAYSLSLHVLEYQTAVMRKDYATGEKVLELLNNDQRNKVARFVEQIGEKELALSVTKDPEHRFDLALQLKKIDLAYEIASTLNHPSKWRQVGDFALNNWRVDLALECFEKAADLDTLLMLYYCVGDLKKMDELSHLAKKEGKLNLQFLSLLLSGDKENALEVLVQSNRTPEAAFFSRTYLPSHTPRMVQLWKDDLSKKPLEKKWADYLSNPAEYENLYPDFKYALLAEMGLKTFTDYSEWKKRTDTDFISIGKQSFPDESALPSVVDLIQQVMAKANLSSSNDADDKKLAPVNSSPVASNPQNVPGSSSSFGTQKGSRIQPRVLEMEETDDNVSHLSMEVNTTGTGSIKGEEEDYETGRHFTGDPELDEILNM